MDCLRTGRSRLLYVVSPRSVVVAKTVRPEVLPLLRDNLHFTLTQLLVLFNLLILVNSVYELAQASDRFPSQGFS